MQDAFVGDIGDYGKYGLLRMVQWAGLSLSVNWYRVVKSQSGKQDDGKYVHYLCEPEKYRKFDTHLFDTLQKIVIDENDRRIERIEHSGLLDADFYSTPIPKERFTWHLQGLAATEESRVVFLDPDNGLETALMKEKGRCGAEYVAQGELLDYYNRGQSVILYQHRPQMMKKADCIKRITDFERTALNADAVQILEFPKFTNRFYFMFLHESDKAILEDVCLEMANRWSGICNRVLL